MANIIFLVKKQTPALVYFFGSWFSWLSKIFCQRIFLLTTLFFCQFLFHALLAFWLSFRLRRCSPKKTGHRGGPFDHRFVGLGSPPRVVA